MTSKRQLRDDLAKSKRYFDAMSQLHGSLLAQVERDRARYGELDARIAALESVSRVSAVRELPSWMAKINNGFSGTPVVKGVAGSVFSGLVSTTPPDDRAPSVADYPTTYPRCNNAGGSGEW